MAERLDEARQKARDEALGTAARRLREYAGKLSEAWNPGFGITLLKLACLDLADELEERANTDAA